MPLDPPQLPTKFPCWCQAIYSWGGETKKDLGFVEGDLIECLNAGDGAWWMGRLRRDQRMVGLFPSNFVRVLSEDFAPEKTRKLSTNGQQPASKPPQKQTTIFRKPFQGYKEAVGPSEALRQKKEEAIRTSALHAVRKRSGTHPSRPASKQISRRSVSPAAARAVSPAPHASHIPQPVAVHSTRAQSPAPATALASASKVPHHQTIASSTTYAHPPPPYPPSPFSGASSRSPLPPSFLPQPLRPPSPALSPSRSPVHKPSQSLQIQPTNAPYNHASNQYSRNELIHRQNSRKRSGSFPTVRHDQPRSRPSLHPISTRLPPPEPLAPGTPDTRAPSPNSIFARAPTPIEQSYMSAGPTYTSSYPENQSLVSYVDSGIDYEDEEDISPPPPPPPHRHRVAMNQPDRMGAPDSSALVVRAGGSQSRYESNLRTPSPNVERKSAEYSNTPSPLRDAMEDVMSSLQDMGLPRDTARSPEISPDPYQPWSSEEFDR
ncbi:acetyl-coenzyme-A carboxylase, partial [Ascosphaera pollenicola]